MPPVCETSEAYFNIQNLGSTTRTYLGLQVAHSNHMESETLPLEPLEKISFQVQDSKDVRFVDFMNQSKFLKIQALCPKIEKPLEFHSNDSPVSHFHLKTNGVIHLKNLSLLKNPVRVFFKLQQSWVEHTAIDLDPLESTSLNTEFKKLPIEIKIESEFRLLSAFSNANSYQSPDHYEVKKIFRDKNKNKFKYFLVGIKTHSGQISNLHESYIVRLDNPEQIQEARSIITENKQRIIHGEIALGHGGFNRDFNSQYKSPYTWHFKSVSGFSELASDACNGDPLKLETHLTDWLNSNPYACFWSYRLIKEIPESLIDAK